MIPILTGLSWKRASRGRRRTRYADAPLGSNHRHDGQRLNDDAVRDGTRQFPESVSFQDPRRRSATFSYEREDGNGFLRLGSGKTLYLDQRVHVEAGDRYTLSLDLRSADPQASVAVTLCEKSVQHSFRCKVASFQRGAPRQAGTPRGQLDSGQVESGPSLLRRPIALSIANARLGSIVDVDNVRLLDESGRDLVANGDFSGGGSRWFFSADDHLPWHIDNLWVQILFEQGGQA